MKNEIGFIGTKHTTQPDYYKRIFANWAAVYIINDIEYYIQSVSDPYDIKNEEIEGFEVLKQNKESLSNVTEKTFKSLKDALRIIEMLKEKERRDNMKKFIMAESTSNNSYKIMVADEHGNKTFLNGEYTEFEEADQVAEKEAEDHKALYVSNR